MWPRLPSTVACKASICCYVFLPCSTALQTVRQLLAHAPFVDGKLSAGLAAKRVKHNEEVAGDAAQLEQLNDIVMGSLVGNSVYRNGAQPQRVATPFYARYTATMCCVDPLNPQPI